MSNFEGLEQGEETIRQLKDATKGYSTEVLKLAIAKTTLDETQIKEILSAKGLKGKILETTTAELAQATATNALSASEATATTVTESFSAAFKGLAASLGISTIALAGIMAGIVAISAAVWVFERFSISSEKAAEKAQEFSDKVTSSRKNAVGNAKTLRELNKEYHELARGVDSLGRNISLSSTQYDRYKEIVGQISEIMPNLTTYFNEQGEAIGFTKGKLEDLTKENKKYIQSQAQAFLNEKGDDGRTLFQGALDNVGMNKEFGLWEQFKKAFKHFFKVYDTDDIASDDAISALENLQNKSKKEMLEYFSSGSEDSLTVGKILGINFRELESMTDDEFNELQRSIASNIETLKNSNEADMSILIEGMIQSAYSRDKFWKIGDGLRNDVTTLLSSINYDTFRALEIDTDNPVAVQTFVGEILDAMSTNKGGITKAWNELFRLDPSTLSADEYVAKVQEYMDTICDVMGIDNTEDRKQYMISLGFDIDTTVGMANGLKDKLTALSNSSEEAGKAGSNTPDGHPRPKPRKSKQDKIQTDPIVSDWIDSLTTRELEFANSTEFEKAIEKRKESLNGASLSANDYDEVLQDLMLSMGEFGVRRHFKWSGDCTVAAN